MAAPRTPEEIRRSIEANRAELGLAVERLRAEVTEVTDWRKQLRKHRKQVLIGAAVAGFVLGGGIAALTGLVTRRRRLARRGRQRRAGRCGGRRLVAVPAHRRSGSRKRLYSTIEIWIAAATGIASSAPSTPNSVEPNSTEVSTTNGCTCTALAWIRGWMMLFSTCW